MKKEIEKMRSQELYDFTDPEILASLVHSDRTCARLSNMTIFDDDYMEVLQELIPGVDPSVRIVPPFRCNHGHGLRLGKNVFLNYNCVALDGAWITIGDNTRIGPGCQLLTPHHPIDHEARREDKETAYPITIGEDCWLGGGVIVLPGVTIGDRCIIAAGSVVTGDIPSDSLAAGVPAKVKKSLR